MIIAISITSFLIHALITAFLFGRLLEVRLGHLGVTVLLTAGMTLMFLAGIRLFDFDSELCFILLKLLCIPAAAFTLHKGSIGRKTVFTLIGAVICLCAEAGGCLAGDVLFRENADISVFAARVMAPDFYLAFSLIEMLIIDRADILREKLRNLSLLVIGFDIIHLVFLVLYFFTEKVDYAELNCLVQSGFQMLLFSIFFVQYQTVLRMRRLTEKEKEYETVKKEIENNRRYYALADLQYKDISKLRHDIQNHFSAVRELLKKREENEDEAKLIMKSISKRLDALGTLEYCSNRKLNSLLTVKLNDRSFKDVGVSIDLNDIEKSPLADNDLCGIISEMMDSAAESCIQCKEGACEFRLFCGCDDGGFVIRAESSFTQADELPSYHVTRLICETERGTLTVLTADGRLTATVKLII